MYDILELNDKLVGELKEIARLLNIQNYDELRKQELVYKILDQQALNPDASNSIKATMESKKTPAKQEASAVKEVEKSTKAEQAADGDGKARRRRVSPKKDESSPHSLPPPPARNCRMCALIGSPPQPHSHRSTTSWSSSRTRFRNWPRLKVSTSKAISSGSSRSVRASRSPASARTTA